MILVVRHGERADWLPEEKAKIELPFDPHLTPKGLKQAFVTGEMIAKLITEYENDLLVKGVLKPGQSVQTVLISSPFVRAVQTAEQISKSVKNILEDTIFLDDALSEWMREDEFEKLVVPELLTKTKTPEYLKKYYNASTKESMIKDPNLLYPVYPEAPDTKRISKFLDSCVDHMLSEKISPLSKVFILVTHRYCCDLTIQHYKIPVELESTGVCGIIQIQHNLEKDSKGYKILMKGESDHVKSIEL